MEKCKIKAEVLNRTRKKGREKNNASFIYF
jgi:hypothetical protein